MKRSFLAAGLITFAAVFLDQVQAQTEATAEPGASTLCGHVTTRDDGRAWPGVGVSIPSLALTATSDPEGRYCIVVPASLIKGQTVEVQADSSGMRPKTATIRLKPGPLSLDFALTLGYREEVTVGSRAAGAEVERAVPVDVVTQQQMATTGATETSAIIEALVPSFNFPRTTLSDGADTVRPATLRGLGPDQVLVLVNGKRRHTSAHIVTSGVIGRGTTGVDLNAIPASALERIEVLRDGAAAQYGSDAIAGVLNLALKTGEQPWTLTGKTGLALGDFTDLTGTSHDFHDGALTEATLSRGFGVAGGSVFFATEYRNRNGTNRASPDLRDQIRPGDAGANAVPQPSHHWGDSEERDILGFVNAVIPLDDRHERFLYAFGGASRRDGSHGGFYRRALDARNWPQIYPLGFLPTI